MIQATFNSSNDERSGSPLLPYGSQHWNGQFQKDGKVRSRSAFMRGMNLIWNPSPRLEVLPQPVSSPKKKSHGMNVLSSWRGDGEKVGQALKAKGNLDASDALDQGSSVPNSSDFESFGRQREFILDGFSAMLAPHVLGSKVPKEIKVKEDDEKTMVEEYQQYR